jgi:hypothetical protein
MPDSVGSPDQTASVKTFIPPPMPQKPYNQACVLQKLAWNLAHDPATKQSTVALLMRSWEQLEERKRILKGKGAPKPVDVQPAKRPGRARSINSHAQPLPDPPAAPAPGAQTP